MAQLLSQVAVGTVVKINENGSPVEFYVAKHNYESALNGSGRTLLVRKNCYSNRPWDSDNINAYATSDIDTWLNNVYKNLLDADIQDAIGTTQFYYTLGNASANILSLSRSIFLLSVTELGRSDQFINVEGSTLPIAPTLQVAYLNDNPNNQWTRTPLKDMQYRTCFLEKDGSFSWTSCYNSYGIRPVFTLAGADIHVLDNGLITTASPPSAPTSITVPTIVIGSPANITWTAATDPDTTITSYTLERNVNSEGWTQIFNGNALTYTDTPQSNWGTVIYRVSATNSYGLSSDYTTSETQTVQSGIIIVNGPDLNIGQITTLYSFNFTLSISGSSTVISDISTDVILDTAVIYSNNLSTGQQVNINIDPKVINGGSHSIVVNASKATYIGAETTYTFNTPIINFPQNGKGTQLQDNDGNVLFPQSVASLISGLYGQSVAGNLQRLTNSVLYNKVSTPKYQEVNINLSSVQEGDIVQLPESGVMTDFYVVKINYESGLNGEGRILFARKDRISMADQGAALVWNASNINTYANSTIDVWLNNTYKAKFPNNLQEAMATTKFYYTPGNNNNTVTTYENSIFLPSMTELGHTDTEAVNIEGSLFPVASLVNGADDSASGYAYNQVTRSPATISTNQIWTIYFPGYSYIQNANLTGLFRPCFTLPSTFTATYYVGLDGIHDSQEYEESGTLVDYWGNPIQSTKVETGTYVGTGTDDAEGASSITFTFDPGLVIIRTEIGSSNFFAMGFFVVSGLQNTSLPYGYALVYEDIDFGQYNYAGYNSETKTLTWYRRAGAADGRAQQLNYLGITYRYFAIG